MNERQGGEGGEEDGTAINWVMGWQPVSEWDAPSCDVRMGKWTENGSPSELFSRVDARVLRWMGTENGSPGESFSQIDARGL